MKDLFRKIFGTGKPEPEVSLALDAVPAWITEREGAAKAVLVSGTREPMAEIRNGIANLQLIINNIAGAEHDPDIHPRLKTIAKNSLPQFVKAMRTSLAKDLPEDPNLFYPIAAECVKNCLHNAHGQGRYLQAIFPDEMKAVRHGIDTIGRGINAINPQLAEYRKEMAGLAAARAAFDEVTGLRNDFSVSEEKVIRSHARISEIRDRHTAIERELAALLQDPGMHEIEEQKSMLADLSLKRDDAARTYSALSMTASHVFRKAEKIAGKQRHPSEIAVLNAAMDMLSDHEIPDSGRLDEMLAASCPVAERMIAAGEVILKNKEERAVFSDTAAFRTSICAAGSELRALEERCLAAEKTLATNPLTMKMLSLEREKNQLAVMLEKENRGLFELQEWRSRTEKQIPELLGGLRKKIAGLSGDNVQLQVKDLSHP